MKLHYDPFQIFYGSKTPAGLYARQKWLAEGESSSWQSDFQEIVDKLLSGQSVDGSWRQSAMATIINLFGLHLTLRNSNNRIEEALGWLIKRIRLEPEGIRVRTDPEIMRANLGGLPFVSSRSEMLFSGATLFLSSIFDNQNNQAVLAIYRRLDKEGLAKEGSKVDIASMHNIFRALVVHPVYANEDLSAKTVEIYAELQTEKGDWGNSVPFCQTLNALAHLNSTPAEIQLENAFSYLIKNQNSDGTWGRHETEWNTFLSIHALKNKDLL